MARINLLTVHWGCSYGGTMQTYATLKLLKDLGHNVTLINLQHPRYKLSAKRKTRFSWIIKELSFMLFRKHYFGKMTKLMFSIDDSLIPSCDYTIVGSDQVWNEDITGPIQMSYFLDFVHNGKKISFASSFGKSKWVENEQVTEIIKTHLQDFSAVSVREDSAVNICKKIFNVDAIHVLDPTLVYHNFSELLSKKRPIHKIYPFLLKRNPQTDEICKIISDETGLPVYYTNKINNLLKVGPKTWINRMHSYDYIVTDSFHGLAFCIIFHKPFIVLCAEKKQFTRLQSLLSLLNLSERFVNNYDDLISRIDIVRKRIDYNEVDKILNMERQKSINFLIQNIK